MQNSAQNVDGSKARSSLQVALFVDAFFKRRILLVIYEWDHVLCTKPNTYSKSTN